MMIIFKQVSLLFGVLVAASILLGCGGGGGGGASVGIDPGGSTTTPIDTGNDVTNPTPGPWTLKSATAASLSAYLREALGPQSANAASRGATATDMTTIAATTTDAAASKSTNAAVFSATTVQELGVDEADLIKSDGVDVFSLDAANSTTSTRSVLRRQRLNANAVDAALLPVDSLTIPFSSDVRGSGIYLDADRKQLVAVADGVGVSAIYDAWFAPQSWHQGVTEVALVDSSNPSQMQMQLHRSLRITAQLIGSRRVGATLYLVMRSYPQVSGLDPAWPTDKVAANQTLVDAIQSSQILPTISIDGATAQPLVNPASCLTQDNNAVKSADIVTLVAIDLASANGQRYASRCFTGGTEAFYMSEQSLYLATTRTAYTYNGTTPVYAAQTSTDIHKFALNGMVISYRGSGNVVGHLGFDQNRKSFRMGEHLGALRVITQTASTWLGWVTATTTVSTTTSVTSTSSVESPAHLSILQESGGNLATVGELPNANRPALLGKAGEQLYASRFVGSRGYLVTYRLTDPLYVLDLSQPSDPKVAGELQVDGYSDYLFPLTDTLLLGVGKDAATDGTQGDGRFAWYQGVKLSLIDLTDAANPKEATRSIIGRRGTDATVLHDHHGIALQTAGNKVRVGLPVSLNDTAPSYSTGAANDYYQFTRTELQKFEIDVSAKTLTPGKTLASTLPNWRDVSDDRALLWNDQVHYYQNGIWRSGGW